MSNLDELKRLAEAAWHQDTNSLGWYTTSAFPDFIHPSEKQFIAACTPATILALLREREALLRVREAAEAYAFNMKRKPIDLVPLKKALLDLHPAVTSKEIER